MKPPSNINPSKALERILLQVNAQKNYKFGEKMKKIYSIPLAVILVFVTMLALGSSSTASADESKVLEFNYMVGLPRPFTGNSNAIRGVPGGGLPWVIDFGKGKLTPDGSIDIVVKGLVFDPNDPAVIERGIGGMNTIPNFKAIVSCLSYDAAGNVIIVNVSTDLFPADEAGNARIKGTLNLPKPCIAPIIFVTSPGGAWFASTGL